VPVSVQPGYPDPAHGGRTARDASGYRCYEESDVGKVRQIRGLLDSGLPTEIIRRILPFLDDPGQIHLPAQVPHRRDGQLAPR
jgi:DNA-binding transcriptional MerR regulator